MQLLVEMFFGVFFSAFSTSVVRLDEFSAVTVYSPPGLVSNKVI